MGDHDINFEGLTKLQKRTVKFLYVTGQNKMAYRMIYNCQIKIKKKPQHLESKKVLQENRIAKRAYVLNGHLPMAYAQRRMPESQIAL